MRRRKDGSRAALAGAASAAVAEVEASLVVPADPAVAAFFDVDNTMMQGASIYYFARGLVKRKYLGAGDLARFALRQLRFRLMAAEHAGDMTSTKAAALAFVAGWPVEEMER